MLLEELQRRGPDGLGSEKYAKGLRMVNAFVTANPGAFEVFKQEKKHADWLAENLDDTPQKSSRLWKAQKDALSKRSVMMNKGRDPGASGDVYKQIKVPQSVEDIPPVAEGSRAAVMQAEEAAGLDTMSGLTSFSEQFNLARKVNGSSAQFNMLYALAKDNLEREGVTLPEGMHPVNYNDNLGQLEALVPIEKEDGEMGVKRVLIDAEFMRVADLGSAADVEEWMAGIGGVLSQIPGAGVAKGATSRAAQKFAQKHPAISEFVGDFGWRNTGVVLEGILDAEALGGGTSLADVAESLEGNLSESGFNTVFSRMAGRLMPGGSGHKKEEIEMLRTQYFRTGDTPQETIDRAVKSVDETIEESAQTLEALQKMTDRRITIDRGQATGSKAEIAVQGGREARLNPREATELTARRQETQEALKDAVDTVHKGRMATNPEAFPGVTQTQTQKAIDVNSKAPRDISHSTLESDDLVEHWWKWNQGSGEVNMGGFGKGEQTLANQNELTGLGSGAKVLVDKTDKSITIKYIGEDTNFPGGTGAMLERILYDLKDVPSDYRIISDTKMSQFSMAMIGRLEKEGWGIRPNDVLWHEKNGNVEWTIAPPGEGVFEITSVPGRMTRIPLIDDMPRYEAERLGGVLDKDLEFIDEAAGLNQFYGVKLSSVIGWQTDKAKSIFHLANPRTSKFNKFATQLQARMKTALTGSEVSQADALLGATFLKQTDEEGYRIIEGLTNPTLDYGALLRSRDSLAAIADRTGDVEVRNLVDAADEMLANGRILDNFGNPATDAQVTSIRTALSDSKMAAESLRNAESRMVSNPLFKRNVDGEYINTDLNTLGNHLRSGSKFMQHVKPWLNGNPEAHLEVQHAVGSLYRKEVLNGGFDRAKHTAFLDKYDTVMKEVFGEKAIRMFKNHNFDGAGGNILTTRVDRGISINNKLSEWGTLRPGHIMEDLRDMAVRTNSGNPRARMKTYMQKLELLSPELAQQVRTDSLEETRRLINGTFFPSKQGADWTPMQGVDAFEQFIKDNEVAMKVLHGDQYVTDLKTIRRGMHMDARRMNISPEAAQLQGDVVRTSRTLMGPLSVFQRRVSAANWIRLRLEARKAVEVLSDPAKLRALHAGAQHPARSRPGVATLIRAGMITGTGWNGGEGVASWQEMPEEVYQQGLEWVDWIQQQGEELAAGGTIEPE
jgi:hypothetical protein